MAQLILSKRFDFILKLSEEIKLMISDYLDVRDVFSYHRVSKSWKNCWTSLPILRNFANRHFRVTFENFVNNPSYNPKNLESWLKTRALQQHNRQQGPYKWKEIYPCVVDIWKHMTYHSGRIAFAVDEHTVNVAANTGILPYSIGDRKVSKVFLSNDLLVVLSSSPQSPASPALSEGVQSPLTLYVWLLESGDHYEISIPSNYKFISLYSNLVAVVMEQNRIMTWTVGGGVNFSAHDPARSPTDEAILFHPTLRDTFVTISKDIARYQSWIVVNEFTRGKHTNTCEFPVFFNGDDNEEFVKFDIRPIDENGLYSICWIDHQVLDDNHACDEYYERGAFFYHLLSYNVYEKTFMIKCFYGGISNLEETDLRPPLDEFGNYCFVWADQMFTPYLDIKSNSLFFQTVWSFKKISESPVPYISENGVGIMSEKDDHEANGFRIFPICKLEHVRDNGEGGHAEMQLCGDDKCVILFTEGGVAQLEC